MKVVTWRDFPTQTVNIAIEVSPPRLDADNNQIPAYWLQSDQVAVQVKEGVIPPTYATFREDIAKELGIKVQGELELEAIDKRYTEEVMKLQSRVIDLFEQVAKGRAGFPMQGV